MFVTVLKRKYEYNNEPTFITLNENHNHFSFAFNIDNSCFYFSFAFFFSLLLLTIKFANTITLGFYETMCFLILKREILEHDLLIAHKRKEFFNFILLKLCE